METIKSFGSYNERRYSRPWVCLMTPTGSYDFSSRVGIYTGAQPGDAGDLMVFEPRTGQVYGYGQKDRRGKKTEISHAVWDGERFVPCDKLGRVK